jgi:hypothetical protein
LLKRRDWDTNKKRAFVKPGRAANRFEAGDDVAAEGSCDGFGPTHQFPTHQFAMCDGSHKMMLGNATRIAMAIRCAIKCGNVP